MRARRCSAAPLVCLDGGGTKRALVAPTVQRLKSPPIETMVEGRMELFWLWSSKLDIVSRILDSFLESNESKLCEDVNR